MVDNADSNNSDGQEHSGVKEADEFARLLQLLMKHPPMTWPDIDGIIISTLTQAIIVNKHDMGGVWGKYYEEHVARLLTTLTAFRQMHEDSSFWWRVRARFTARVKCDEELTSDLMEQTVIDNDAQDVPPFTPHGPLWHLVHAVFETINMDLEMPDYAHFERMPESAYPKKGPHTLIHNDLLQQFIDAAVPVKSVGEVGFNEYANRVAEVYAVEGGQIKPADPRLRLPDKRCPTCVATMSEPQPLSPVRRQVHEKLQTGWHLPECPYKGGAHGEAQG